MATIFNYKTLAMFRHKMYSTLLYKDDLCKETAKLVEFKDDDPNPKKCFFLRRDNTLFILPYEALVNLPIRPTTTEELVTKQNDIVQYIKSAKSFKITAERMYSFKDLVDLDYLQHTNPDEWTLWKIVCWCARIARINIRVSSNPGWGKNAYPQIIHELYDKMYAIVPDSVAGVSKGISADGCIVLDELGKLKSEVKPVVAKFLYQLGGMNNEFKPGTAGSIGYGTKYIYNTSRLSLICLYNRLQDYDDRKDFFDFMFSNSNAINDRMLPLKLSDGRLDISQFNNAPEFTDEVEQIYRNIMKTAEYYRVSWETLVKDVGIEKWLENYSYIRDRHKISFLTIAYFIYLYTGDDQEEFKKYMDLLGKWYKDYIYMVKPEFERNELKEEII